MLVLHKHVLTTQTQIHESIFCFLSLLRVVSGILNPVPVNITQDGYKLLLDANSSNVIYCSPGSHQDAEMLRSRGGKRKDKTKQSWHVGKKLTLALLLTPQTHVFH